jgi:hypothetical protein
VSVLRNRSSSSAGPALSKSSSRSPNASAKPSAYQETRPEPETFDYGNGAVSSVGAMLTLAKSGLSGPTTWTNVRRDQACVIRTSRR